MPDGDGHQLYPTFLEVRAATARRQVSQSAARSPFKAVHEHGELKIGFVRRSFSVEGRRFSVAFRESYLVDEESSENSPSCPHQPNAVFRCTNLGTDPWQRPVSEATL